jgi:hypothetical protein
LMAGSLHAQDAFLGEGHLCGLGLMRLRRQAR